MNEQEARHFVIRMAKLGAASAAKAKIIQNDDAAWKRSNFIGKSADEAYEETARYAAHLFGESGGFLKALMGTASPKEISKMECPKTKHQNEWYNWNEKSRREQLTDEGSTQEEWRPQNDPSS